MPPEAAQILLLLFPFFCEDIAVVLKIIAFFALRDRPVFDGLNRTVLDAGHAVRAGPAFPDRFTAVHRDDMQRAEPFALSA